MATRLLAAAALRRRAGRVFLGIECTFDDTAVGVVSSSRKILADVRGHQDHSRSVSCPCRASSSFLSPLSFSVSLSLLFLCLCLVLVFFMAALCPLSLFSLFPTSTSSSAFLFPFLSCSLIRCHGQLTCTDFSFFLCVGPHPLSCSLCSHLFPLTSLLLSCLLSRTLLFSLRFHPSLFSLPLYLCGFTLFPSSCPSFSFTFLLCLQTSIYISPLF